LYNTESIYTMHPSNHTAQSYVYFWVVHHPSVPPKSYVYLLGTISSIHMAIQYYIQVHHLSIHTTQSHV
jgi:hypothetical protein